VPGSGYGAGCGEKRGSFQRTGLHASRILVGIQGCKTVAMRFNHRPLLLGLGEKGFYSSYTQPSYISHRITELFAQVTGRQGL